MNKDEKVACYKQVLESAGIELKGKNNLYTSSNGHMFSFVGQQDIVAIRISKEDQKKFLEKYKTPFPVRQYNSNMHDYVELPDELLKNTDEAAKYLKQALAYVNSLPPK